MRKPIILYLLFFLFAVHSGATAQTFSEILGRPTDTSIT
ncbi:MAG: hypothetical protein RLY16_2540, partial [Bacteroidota bacterium]